MNRIKCFPGDIALISGAHVSVDRTVTLSSEAEIERIPTPGILDLPETDQRVWDLWERQGHRVRMTTRQDLRCPCGSVYVRHSATHHSCQRCRRVWPNEKVPA